MSTPGVVNPRAPSFVYPEEIRMPLDDVCAPDPSAYGALVEAHYARVLRLCSLLLRDQQEAKEVTQETFLRLHQHHASGRVRDWGAWLTRVAVNASRDRQRAGWWPRWRRHTEPLDESDLVADTPSPHESVVSADTRRHIARAFAALPRRQREVFALRQVDGLSTAAAAAALGVSEGSVKRHLFRAIQTLRQALREADR